MHGETPGAILRRQWVVPLGVQHMGEARPHVDETSGCSLMSVHIFHSLLPTMSPLRWLLKCSLHSRESQHKFKKKKKSHQLLFTTKSETSLVAKWVLDPNSRMSDRGSEQLEGWGLISWLGKITIKYLFSCRNGCLPNLQCNTEDLLLVLQSFKISDLLCTAADKCTQNDRAISHIYSLCLYSQCL